MDNIQSISDAFSPTAELKRLFAMRDAAFWQALERQSFAARTFNELVVLSALRKKALKSDIAGSRAKTETLRTALIGGSTLYPLSDLIEHLLTLAVGSVEIFTGDYNNYRAEILDENSALYEFQPDFVILLPDEKSCRYGGRLTDAAETVASEVDRVVADLLGLCRVVQEKSGAEIILCNFVLPPFIDLGAYRTKAAASDWNFKKAVNLALGAKAPGFVHICDLEFLAYRLGGLAAKDEKAWFESKQMCSPSLQAAAAKEIAHLIGSVKRAPKKVLALDLDNTLWGGVIGDDGLEGIEIGDTSPRGEAFKAFQAYVLSLIERGVLLAACSKNDFEAAIEPFRRHPEMILREEHFVSFKANWQPKAQNLIEMAADLNLGLDSFVFVDDNPAEIENVRRFAPEVATILLDPDPSQFVRQLQESRLFERFSITGEDGSRTEQYRTEAERRALQTNSVDMDSYLQSLEMVATLSDFNRVDLPRTAQLINKSNQFNLTTKRRTEAELETLMRDSGFFGFTMRLADRFGDHGLISVVICRLAENETLEIDTWLMSCRVLKRGVEDEVLNEIARRAKSAGCRRIRGVYLPTAKNKMVAGLYPQMGFDRIAADESRFVYELSIERFAPLPTFISINARSNRNEHIEKRNNVAAASHL